MLCKLFTYLVMQIRRFVSGCGINYSTNLALYQDFTQNSSIKVPETIQ